MTTNDRDAMIRLAIAPAADVLAPADLGDTIYAEIIATPQRRGVIRLGHLGWVPAPSPQLVSLLLLVLLAVALIVAGLLRPPEPPVLTMYHGGPDRTGLMPGPGPVGDVIKGWDVEAHGAIAFTSMPLPTDGRLFVGDVGGWLAALDPADGHPIWEVDVGSAIYGAPALVDGLVVVGTEAGEVVALDATTGARAWGEALDAGAVLASPLVADGVLYAGTEGGWIIALDPQNGNVRWRFDVEAAVTRGPSYADGALFVGTASGKLLAIDVDTGSLRWPVQLAPGEVGTPAVARGRVYVGEGIHGAQSHDLVAIDARNGMVLWRFRSPSGVQVHLGAIAHGRVYATGEDGSLYALDPATGSLLRTFEIGGRLGSLATVVGDVIHVGSSPDLVVAIDATSGAEVWRIEVDGEPTMAAVLQGRAYVGTNLGRVVAITGAETK